MRLFSLLPLLLLSQMAVAEELAQTPAAHPLTQWALLGGFLLIFYFLIWRPQSQRAKGHRQMVEQMAAGDEIVTLGGVVGIVEDIRDHYLTLTIDENVKITLQKQAISAVLPKGTLAAR